MCGRLSIEFDWDQVWVFSSPFRGPGERVAKSLNIAPTSIVRVFTADEQGPLASLMQWWLIPSWSKDRKSRYSTFNARSEDAASKPAFRGPMRHSRCVLPVSGFYEWKTLSDGSKQQHSIRRADGQPMFLAGLWDHWEDASETLESCTILTTEPNDQMAQIHNRMPCVLEPEDLLAWMDPDEQDPKAVMHLLRPAADGVLEIKPTTPKTSGPSSEQSLWPS